MSLAESSKASLWGGATDHIVKAPKRNGVPVSEHSQRRIRVKALDLMAQGEAGFSEGLKLEKSGTSK